MLRSSHSRLSFSFSRRTRDSARLFSIILFLFLFQTRQFPRPISSHAHVTFIVSHVSFVLVCLVIVT